MYVCAYTCTHTGTPMQAHTCMCAHMQAYTCIHVGMPTDMHTHTNTHVHTGTHRGTCTHTGMHTYTHAQVNVKINVKRLKFHLVLGIALRALCMPSWHPTTETHPF